jgi:hypothetical protein
MAIPEPYRAVVLVPRSHGDARAFLRRGWAWSHEARGHSRAISCWVMGSVPQGTWRHWSPFPTGGTLGALGHVVTLEPFPGRCMLYATGNVATSEPSSGRWHALCLEARGGARALWHRERIWSRGADLLSLVHGGTQSVGYKQCPPGPPRERQRTHRWGQYLVPVQL